MITNNNTNLAVKLDAQGRLIGDYWRGTHD